MKYSKPLILEIHLPTIVMDNQKTSKLLTLVDSTRLLRVELDSSAENLVAVISDAYRSPPGFNAKPDFNVSDNMWTCP
jgi:hypothetical protein